MMIVKMRKNGHLSQVGWCLSSALSHSVKSLQQLANEDLEDDDSEDEEEWSL